MSKKIIDISIPVVSKMPYWPGGSSPRFKSIFKIGKKSEVNESALEMNAHAGTHIDAPLHFVAHGRSIDALPLDTFVGPVLVVHLPRVTEITAAHLEQTNIPVGTKRILFKTSNSLLWQKKVTSFKKEYVGITVDAAMWLAKQKFLLVGVDYLSVAKFSEATKVHQILLGKGIALLEGIDLTPAKAGEYELVCLPLKTIGSEAAPVRAVLIQK